MPCYYITKAEELLLNDINQNHSGEKCKSYVFKASKDFTNNLEDILKLYTMLNSLSLQLQHKIKYFNKKTHGYFMHSIGNVTFILPYILINEIKYVPLFYLDGFRYKSVQLLNLYNSSIDLNYLNFAYLNLYCNVYAWNNQYFCFDKSFYKNAFINGLSTLKIGTPNKRETRYLTVINNFLKMLFNLTNAYIENYGSLINVHQIIKMERIEMPELKSIEQTNTQVVSTTILTTERQTIPIIQNTQCTSITSQNGKSMNQMVHIKYLIN